MSTPKHMFWHVVWMVLFEVVGLVGVAVGQPASVHVSGGVAPQGVTSNLGCYIEGGPLEGALAIERHRTCTIDVGTQMPFYGTGEITFDLQGSASESGNLHAGARIQGSLSNYPGGPVLHAAVHSAVTDALSITPLLNAPSAAHVMFRMFLEGEIVSSTPRGGGAANLRLYVGGASQTIGWGSADPLPEARGDLLVDYHMFRSPQSLQMFLDVHAGVSPQTGASSFDVFSNFLNTAGLSSIQVLDRDGADITQYYSLTTLSGRVYGSTAPDPVVTPEPMSLALLGTGLAGLGAMRRRRRTDLEVVV